MINAAVVTLFDEARKIAADYDNRIACSTDYELAEVNFPGWAELHRLLIGRQILARPTSPTFRHPV